MSLVARHLESAGFVTVVIGSARDIVEQCGVPRFLFSDLPLGHPLGLPWDQDGHRETLDLALQLAETAFAPRTTITSPASFGDEGRWRNSYMEITPEKLEKLKAEGEARRRKQAARRGE